MKVQGQFYLESGAGLSNHVQEWRRASLKSRDPTFFASTPTLEALLCKY